MKFARIFAYRVELPLADRLYNLSGGEPMKSLRSILLLIGMAVACPPVYAGDTKLPATHLAQSSGDCACGVTPTNPQPGPGKTPMKSDDSSSQLTVERIFSTDEFQEERIGTIIWSKLAAAYFTLKEPAAEGAGQALIRVDAASGTEEVAVPASALIPSGESNSPG